MNTYELLEDLKEKAQKDPLIREKLIATQNSAHPLASFCKIARLLGYPLYEMDVINAGEEFHAAMKRSTNGGGENSPMLEGQDSFYDLFFVDL